MHRIKLLNLGVSAYKDAFKMMKKIEKSHLDRIEKGEIEPIQNCLILTTHTPTYTMGTQDNTAACNYDEDRLRALGADYVLTDRGGLVTFHGPGQLILYPILDLFVFKLKTIEYVNLLEKTMIDTCADFGVRACKTNDIGIWVGDNKIGALGVHIRGKRITTHGIALNCNIDLSWFSHVVPCGLCDKGTTSLSHELKSTVTTTSVEPYILNHFEKNFNAKLYEHNLPENSN